MKSGSSYIIVLLLVFSSACEFEQEETHCYPVRIKSTLSTGAGAASTTADYKYEGKLVDRIIWSNKQTHYFSYDTENRLAKVEEFNIRTLQETEYRLTYDGFQLSRIDKFISSLDYRTQEPVDTTHIGYQTFTHSGANVSEEEVFGRESEDEDFALLYTREYSYDLAGNITGMVSMNAISGDTAEA
ncbi:MAG: hypothetical protein R3356_05135, partial [Eudoraea sp.]|nr:hypothetical protein [Eudoraea sp.]